MLTKRTSSDKKQDFSQGLNKSKKSFFSRISRIIVGKTRINSDVLDSLEEVLLTADVGVPTTIKIIDALEQRVAKQPYLNLKELYHILKQEMVRLMFSEDSKNSLEHSKNKPYVFLVVGVNGVGKTTTIGKLAAQFKSQGLKVVLGAADTFRAAAIDQLALWADRVGVSIVKQQMGSDPASVAFDTFNSAIAQNADVVIIDTAGRLHNNVNLMNELSKIKKVLQKKRPDKPDEVLLVLDGSTGQNAFEQAKKFTKATEVTGLVVTKLDGTAKGGVVLGISDQFEIPVKYIGLGEKIADLQAFDKVKFVDAFFSMD